MLADSIEGGMGIACRSEVNRLVAEGFPVTYAAPDVGALLVPPAGASLASVRVPAAVRDVLGMLRARKDLLALVRTKGTECVVHAHGLRSGMVASGLTTKNRIIVTHHGGPDLDLQRRIYARLLPKRVWKATSGVPLNITGWTHWWHWSPVLDAQRGADGRYHWAPARQPVDPGGPVLGWFGRIDAPKRPDVWLEILGTVRAAGQPVRGVVVGDGPLLDDMRATAQRLNLPVEFLGRQNPATAMQTMDVLLTWSDSEGVLFVNQEAIALGVPVITNDIPGPSAFLGEAGGVVSVQTARATLQHIFEPSAREALLRSQQARMDRLRTEGTFEDHLVELLRRG